MITALLLAATLTPFDHVVAAERAFAAASVEKGTHEAFLENLAEDSIMFHPFPAPARAAHEGKPRSGETLTWGPAWVVVSSAGDLALSTGPWLFRPPEDSALTPTTGMFISVWRKQADGAWKVAVDAGVSSRLTFAIPMTVEDGFAGAPAPPPQRAQAAKAGITSAERALTAAAKTGLGGALATRTDALVRVYRERRPAGIGPLAARDLLGTDKRLATCTPERIVTAASGDLGYSYGTCLTTDGGEEAKTGFLHVWRRQTDGSWRILIDVTP